MVDEPRNPDLVDPLRGYSTLALFPRTFRDPAKVAKLEGEDTDSIHNYFKSMALRSPKKLLDQAKSIVNSGSELLNSMLPTHVASGDKDDHAVAKGEVRPQERRPALGRKRARFSLKPNSSQPPISVEPILDIDQLQDPEEFFLAHEKHENAKKELQRQRGDVLIDLDEHNKSTTVRRRRPGILGKTASYRHHYSSALGDDEETHVSSQEIFGVEIQSSLDHSSQREVTENMELPKSEIAGDKLADDIDEGGSIAETENRVKSLLDELLNSKCTDLDGDGALNFLQDRLQIKPVNLKKLFLPDLDVTHRNDVKLSEEKSVRPRKALSDIHNTIKRVKSATSGENRHIVESSDHPAPPKSPFASISLFKKRILHTGSSNDPFSALDIYSSPTEHSSPVGIVDKLAVSANLDSDQLDANNPVPSGINGKELNFLSNFQSHEDEGNMVSGELGKEDLVCPVERRTDENYRKYDNLTNARPNAVDGDLRYNTEGSTEVAGELAREDLASPLERPMDVNSSKLYDGIDSTSNVTNGDLDDNVRDVLNEAVVSDQANLSVKGLSTETLDCSGSKLGDRHAMDGPSETTEVCLEQNDLEPSRILLGESSKPKTTLHRRHKRKELSHRQSLAEAGTLWKSGVRRSTRIKMRPLEYWKGERFLYGRIHESLTTIIGLKYVSPEKGNGKPTVRVKSYVPDEYKELVEQAALH